MFKNLKYFLIPILLLIMSSYAVFKNLIPAKIASSTNTITYKGMNLVAPIKELKSKTFEELKDNNINSISLIPYAFVNTDEITINYDNGRQWWGETSEGIKECIQQAHANNFKLMLKPHLWINHNTFTGHLDFKTESDWQKWETAYEKYILNFAQIAESQKIAIFCFGTELENPILKRPQYWLQLIQKIRKVYSGKLTYAANWDEFDKIPFWNELDFIGIDAYFPLSKSETPSVEELNLSWKKHILKIELIQKKYKKNVVFTEFGYRNSNNCADEPWTETNAIENNQAQANSYESLFQSFENKPWYKGGFAWKWFADDYYKERRYIDFTPQGKPALTIIKKYYK
ncbi:glycoside hydrolase family 113 [Flavobacterium cellulosilyticum]|uniref:Glycoside hydrolase n=1 Tax=Flavobacterium cellulosilyticum TaxID=2541731 RepID=A0A4R5CBC6_9FLAO|nr:hypothetical protein [Flavobacterium cellulosilyticum]TDD95530.1 hypothetical protein E0F76_13780 [Flavobacterium cellulosilyticum]